MFPVAAGSGTGDGPGDRRDLQFLGTAAKRFSTQDLIGGAVGGAELRFLDLRAGPSDQQGPEQRCD